MSKSLEMETAISSNFTGFDALIAPIKKEPEEVKQVTDNNELIAELADDERFSAYAERIEMYINELDDLLAQVTSSEHMTMAEIGFRFLAVKVTKEYLSALKTLPADYAAIKKACKTETEKKNKQK